MKNKVLLAVTAVIMLSGTLQADEKSVSKKKNVTFDLNIRYVDSYAVIRDSKDGQILAKELEDKRLELGKELKEMEEKFTTMAKSFQTKASTLSESGRAREQKDLTKMEREYKSKLQESEEDMKITMKMGQERLLREHNDAVFNYAKADGIDLVFGPGGVIFASEKANCTFDIVEGMNKNYEIKLAKAREPKKSTVVASTSNKKVSA